jgi:DNA polymerase-3 subunit alpha
MAVLDKALELAQCFQRDRLNRQYSFFDTEGSSFKLDAEKFIPQINEWPKEQILKFERDLLGFYVSGHPLEEHREIIQKYSTSNSKDILNLKEGSEVIIGGLISSLKKKVTKNNDQRMAIITLEDLEGCITGVVFPELYQKKAHLIVEGGIVFIKARFSIRGDQPQIIAGDVIPIEEAPFKLVSHVELELEQDQELEVKIQKLLEIMEKYRGEVPFRIIYKEPRGKVILESGQKVEVRKELLEEIKDKLGLDLSLS